MHLQPLSHSNPNYDIVVIGGGPVGLSAAYQCAKTGKRVLLLERYCFKNDRGSSTGNSRFWRIMYSESYLSKLAMETSPLWDQWETEAQTELIRRTGLLNFGETNIGDSPEGSLHTAIETMQQLGIQHELLTSREIHEKYPFRDLPRDFIGVFQKDAGAINVREVLDFLLKRCRDFGVTLLENSEVTGISNAQDGVEVYSSIGMFKGTKVILCPGAYAKSLLKIMKLDLNMLVWEMTSAYFRRTDKNTNYPLWFQFKKATSGKSELFYGFPDLSWDQPGFCKIAVDFSSKVFDDPEKRDHTPSGADLEMTVNFVKRHLIGVDSVPLLQSTCVMGILPDNNFILDFAPATIPGNKDIVICASGWAFKFVPILGKICAELAMEGKTAHDISHYAATRSGVLLQ